MPVKKRGKKKANKVIKRAKKNFVTKHVARIVAVPKRNRIPIVLKNLLLFGILCVLSVIIAFLSNNELIDTMFWFLVWLTASVEVAFLIILLVLLFVRKLRK